jgi:hypothetical protein
MRGGGRLKAVCVLECDGSHGAWDTVSIFFLCSACSWRSREYVWSYGVEIYGKCWKYGPDDLFRRTVPV